MYLPDKSKEHYKNGYEGKQKLIALFILIRL